MNKKLLFTTSTELLRLSPDAIVFIIADGNYSTIKLVDGSEYILTLQLGQVEKKIQESVAQTDLRFTRIGKSLIVNRDFIIYLHPAKQKMILSDGHNFKYELSASKEALRALKDFIEKEIA